MTSFQKKLTYEKFYKKMPDGDLDNLVELMDTKDFDVNYQNPDNWGYTPLMMAALYD